jgi:hypothetical protein
MATRKEVCEKCGERSVRIVQTDLLFDGSRVRRRRCDSCDRIFYTLQQPELRISKSSLLWGEGSGKGRIVGLSQQPESRQKEKV